MWTSPKIQSKVRPRNIVESTSFNFSLLIKIEPETFFTFGNKAPSEATFRGAEFLSYDLTQTGGEPIVSAQDAISLYFKTRQPNGLLFYTGHEADYLNLAVRDGGVSLTMGLGNGKQEMHIKPARTRFDDHQWHKLTVHRRIQEFGSGRAPPLCGEGGARGRADGAKERIGGGRAA
ncbi:Neurexin-3 [Eumeta japonica]|uniref:Neurexin-3 n=1 Tax=Eumeta variegata TaxID=151549 RepID=A0A4C1VQ34_EUMVA|nr:Neurexin-3 [Eumeta japonica]